MTVPLLAEMPLAAFDLETTGVDVRRDRIVTASLVTIDGATIDVREWLVNPDIEIPESAAKVHGITTDKAAADGQDYSDGYREIRDALETCWAQGRIVAIMNAAFDLSMLHHEGVRLDYPPLVVGPVIDPYVCDKHLDPYRRGKRTLTALCEHYGLRQDDAHQSTGDALAAARLAWRMLRLDDFASFADTDSLMLAQQLWRAEQQASLGEYFTRQGNHEAAAGVDGAWPIIGKEPAA